MANICKFKFQDSISKEQIEEQLALALLATESVFGKAKARLNVTYAASTGVAVVDISNEIGSHAALVFVGLMNRLVGEENFTVEKIFKKDSD